MSVIKVSSSFGTVEVKECDTIDVSTIQVVQDNLDVHDAFAALAQACSERTLCDKPDSD